jgi:hypothetical protein
MVVLFGDLWSRRKSEERERAGDGGRRRDHRMAMLEREREQKKRRPIDGPETRTKSNVEKNKAS